MEAEECFRKTIAIARCQNAKSLELRAAMSLSRLLAEIYGWFIEGFDTVDLKETKILLEQLSR